MQQTQRNRTLKFVAAAATATMAAAMIAVGAPSATAAVAVTVSGKLVGGFTPTVVHVTAGVPTTITYKNTDSSDHDFTVTDLSFQVAAAGGASASKVLTATAAQVGSHKFICSISGHSALMFGTLIVDPAGTKTVPATAAAGTSAAGTPAVAGSAAAGPAAANLSGVAGAQVSSIPSGGVQTGGGSTAGFAHSGLMTLGGGLLMAAFMSAFYGRRVARRN
jgi:plastocyanin